MKNINKTQRIALCVHIDEEYISKIYSWALPDSIENIECGTVLEVENFDDTADVIFIKEQIVTDDIERKSVLKVADWQLGREYSHKYKEILIEVRKIKDTLDSGEYSPEEYTGFDLEYARGGFKKSKRIAYCAYADKNSISKLFPVYITDHFNKIEPGTPVVIEDTYWESSRNAIFIFEREEPLSFKTKYRITSGHGRHVIDGDVKKAIRSIAKDLETGNHQPEEFPGFDMVLGWDKWRKYPTKNMTKEEYKKDLASRQEARFEKEKLSGSINHRVRKISHKDIVPYRLYIEVEAESVSYKTIENEPIWNARYFILAHNCKGEVGECISGDAQVIEKEFGFVGNTQSHSIAKTRCLRNPTKKEVLKKDSLFFEFIEDEEQLLNGWVHSPITLLNKTVKNFTLSDGTECRFVPALEEMKVWPWLDPEDERVIHILKHKGTKFLDETLLEEAREHLADDGQVYILEVLQEMAGKFFWDTVIQTTYCHRYCTPIIFNATSTKEEAFEESHRFATAYVYQNGIDQYKSVSLYQKFWYSPGNYSNYCR